MSLLKITIPNIFNSPYIVSPQTINENTYFFEYRWNIRHEILYLSIYSFDNNEEVYLVKGIPLNMDVEISRYIIDDNWVGGLWFTSDKSYDFGYNIKTVSDDFYLFYNSEYVGKH